MSDDKKPGVMLAVPLLGPGNSKVEYVRIPQMKIMPDIIRWRGLDYVNKFGDGVYHFSAIFHVVDDVKRPRGSTVEPESPPRELSKANVRIDAKIAYELWDFCVSEDHVVWASVLKDSLEIDAPGFMKNAC
jgi:hypothetical protein